MPWSRPSLLLLSPLLGFACQTNTIELELDSEAVPPASTGDAPTSGATEPSTGDVDTTAGGPDGPQTLHFVLSTPVDPSLPFQAIVTTTPGAGTIDLTLQWLSLSLGSTNAPRLLVGDQYAYPGLPVDAAGGFYWDTGILLIPGAANPVSGEDFVTSIQLAGTPGAGDVAYCGAAGGTVTVPFEMTLEGSSYSMTAVPDPATLPAQPLLGCP